MPPIEFAGTEQLSRVDRSFESRGVCSMHSDTMVEKRGREIYLMTDNLLNENFEPVVTPGMIIIQNEPSFEAFEDNFQPPPVQHEISFN